MVCAGLDLSTRALDFVILNTDNPAECEHRRVQLATEDGKWWESARGMRAALDSLEHSEMDDYPWIEFFTYCGVSLLGIERPYGPSRGSIASLHTILGAVLATIPQHITVLEVRPAEMRKALGLKGNVSKGAMHFAAAEFFRLRGAKLPSEWLPAKNGCFQDPADAWAVAWAAYRMCEKAAA